MKPPDGLDMRVTDRDLANNAVTVAVTAREVTHACPPTGSGVMPCCERTPFEVPRWHRMTLDPDLVTCDGSNRGDVR